MSDPQVWVRAQTSAGKVRTVVEVTRARAVRIRTGGTVLDEGAVALLVALGTPPPGWFLAAPLKAALDVDADVDPTDVLALVRDNVAGRTTLIEHAPLVPWQWHALSLDASERVRTTLAAATADGSVCGPVPPPVAARLARDPQTQVRAALATHLPVAPEHEDTWVVLAADAHPGVSMTAQRRRSGVADRLPPREAALVLSADDNDRWEAAGDPYLSLESRLLLAGDPQEDVRRHLAARPDLPEQVAVTLAKDTATSVQMQIALFTAPTVPVMAALLASPSAQVRHTAVLRARGAARRDRALAAWLDVQGLR